MVLTVVMLLCVAGCNSTDFKTDVQGDWILYHYYESAENGEDAFTVTAADASMEEVGGTITWIKADEAEVVMNDGTRCTMRISKNDKKHGASAEF